MKGWIMRLLVSLATACLLVSQFHFTLVHCTYIPVNSDSTRGRSSGLESLANAESHDMHRQNAVPVILGPGFVAQRQQGVT
jgi:hypothetical protein